MHPPAPWRAHEAALVAFTLGVVGLEPVAHCAGCRRDYMISEFEQLPPAAGGLRPEGATLDEDPFEYRNCTCHSTIVRALRPIVD